MKYEKLNEAFKHVGYNPYRFVHIVDVTTEAVDFDHREKERVDQLVIGSEEPMTEEQLKEEARAKLMEENPDFQFFREVRVAKLDVVQCFDLELQ